MGSLYAYRADEWRRLEGDFALSHRELAVRSLVNGIILPARRMKSRRFGFEGGVVDENLNFVEGLVRWAPDHLSDWELNGAAYQPETCKKLEETVIFGGAAVTHFGHFLLDGMTRLWYILQNPETHNFRIAIILIPLRSSFAWLYEFFSLLGIPRERLLIVNEPTQFRRIVLPEESAHTLSGCFTKEYLVPFSRLVAKGKSSPLKKVFLSKSRNKTSDICNESYFRKFYAGKGYVIIHTEEFSLEEQIGILYHANEIVSMAGTLSHLALFCSSGARFTVLLPTDIPHMRHVARLQAFIHKIKGIQWNVVDVSQNFLYNEHWRGVHLAGASQYWQQYVLEQWGTEICDDTLAECSYAYMKEWLLFYERYPHALINYCRANNAADIFLRMYQVFLGKKPDKKILSILKKEQWSRKGDE